MHKDGINGRSLEPIVREDRQNSDTAQTMVKELLDQTPEKNNNFTLNIDLFMITF